MFSTGLGTSTRDAKPISHKGEDASAPKAPAPVTPTKKPRSKHRDNEAETEKRSAELDKVKKRKITDSEDDTFASQAVNSSPEPARVSDETSPGHRGARTGNENRNGKQKSGTSIPSKSRPRLSSDPWRSHALVF